MKNSKKLLSIFLIIFSALFLINTFNVKADAPILEAIDGASIRTEGEQGLRFYAYLDESAVENEHGFYLVYGETTVASLELAIANPVDEKVILNEKEVFRVVVNGVTQDNEYSIVLTGIPEEGYLTQISVIPFVVVNEEDVLTEDTVSRSIGQVALAMARSGDDSVDVEELLENHKRVGFDAFNNLVITNNLYETNHFLLREEFINDWNEKFGTTWTELDADLFFNSAKEGLDPEEAIGANKDLKEGNLYKFFNDEPTKDKWGWLLDFIKSVDGTTHTSRQIVAIKGVGTNGEYLLYQANHLSYSIANFFNQAYEVGAYTAVDFTLLSRYNDLTVFNNKVYINYNHYEFYYIGEEATAPLPEERTGYNFVSYKDGEVVLNPGLFVIASTNHKFSPIYEAIEYDVTFYDEENEITELSTTYNIETGLVLPSHFEEGKSFDGWYSNPELTGSAITNIPVGNTGAKVYYAKWSEIANVIYDFGEYGYISEDTKEDILFDFVVDYKDLYGRTANTAEELYENFAAKSYIPGNIEDIFKASYKDGKWVWLKEYILDLASKTNYDGEAVLLNWDQTAWRTNIEALIEEKQFNFAGTRESMDFSIVEHAHGFWRYTPYYKTVISSIEGLLDGNTIISWNLNYKFGGWYDNPEFTGSEVTEIPSELQGDLLLYAKWVLK